MWLKVLAAPWPFWLFNPKLLKYTNKRSNSLRSVTAVMKLLTFYLIYHCLHSILFLYHWKYHAGVALSMSTVSISTTMGYSLSIDLVWLLRVGHGKLLVLHYLSKWHFSSSEEFFWLNFQTNSYSSSRLKCFCGGVVSWFLVKFTSVSCYSWMFSWTRHKTVS